MQPVDMASLRNLIDSGDEEFLRRHLSAGDFPRVQAVI